jgi:acyl-CoA synthetase (AMP-forming)/AMP-acid ligase II
MVTENYPGGPELPYRPTMGTIARRAATEFGDADFIVLADRRISFRRADAVSRRLARELLAAGVGKGTRVGLQLLTGPEWAVAWMAITRIGAIAMPFSTLFRPAELRRALRIGDVAILLTQSTMLGKDHQEYLEEAVPALTDATDDSLLTPSLPYLRAIWLLGEHDRSWAQPFDAWSPGASSSRPVVSEALLESVETEVTPADDMTVIFTSGTTADPKAVAHTHGAVVRKTSPVSEAGLSASYPGRVLCYMPFFWIGGVQSVAGALQSGAAVLTQERLDGRSALELAAREKATTINGNATTLRSVLGPPGSPIGSIPSLQPSRAGPWTGPRSDRGDDPIPLGMTETMGPWAAVEGFDYEVADPDTGVALPEGQVGEFWVRGYGLMRGLYKREREEVFTPDGYYRTGDRGYINGRLVYFLGRLTDMIKTSGANVAPPEVERVINECPGVELAVVAGLPHSERGEEVAALVVAESGATVAVDSLLDECRKQLSPYKVPTFIAVVEPDRLIWTATSKLDRRAATQLLLELRAARSEPVA